MEILSRMYLIDFIAQVCVVFSETRDTDQVPIVKKIYENKTPPIQASMVRLTRKSFPTLEIWSRMYLIDFIAQVCVVFSETR